MIHGTYYLGNWRVACRNMYCTSCRAPRLAIGRRAIVVLHLCFIPVLPIGTTVRWYCTRCSRKVDALRPSRPAILIAGVSFCVLMMFMGVMIIIEGEPAMTHTGVVALLVGFLMGAGLVYLLTKRDYSAYHSGAQSVVPLNGSACPLCGGPLLPGTRPRCEACRVNVVTS